MCPPLITCCGSWGFFIEVGLHGSIREVQLDNFIVIATLMVIIEHVPSSCSESGGHELLLFSREFAQSGLPEL